jgi:hypothetical protein
MSASTRKGSLLALGVSEVELSTPRGDERPCRVAETPATPLRDFGVAER